MDVENGYLARRRKGDEQLPVTGQASGWMAVEAISGADADFQQSAPDDRARAEEKFGVYREALFDFRDYGLD